MEEEVGQYGHEQTVIIAEEKDSTQAKATSAVHVPHKDTTTADHQLVNVEDNWSENDIKVLEGMNAASKNVTTNVTGDGTDANTDQSEYFTEGEPEDQEEAPELTEEELEEKRIEDENRQIEENFDQYSEMNVEEETKKLQEKELAKNKRKAVSTFTCQKLLPISCNMKLVQNLGTPSS